MEAQRGGTHWTFGVDDVDDLERVGKAEKGILYILVF